MRKVIGLMVLYVPPVHTSVPHGVGGLFSPNAFENLRDEVISRVGYLLNFIDFDSDSAYRFRFFSIPSFDSNVIR